MAGHEIGEAGVGEVGAGSSVPHDLYQGLWIVILIKNNKNKRIIIAI